VCLCTNQIFLGFWGTWHKESPTFEGRCLIFYGYFQLLGTYYFITF
jgi:hypothetical protein